MWTFPLADPALTLGSMLDVVVAPGAEGAGSSNRVLDSGRGHLQLVSTTHAAEGGRIRYEYALMNFDFDGQIQRFSVPVAEQVEVEAVGFTGFGPGLGASWSASRESDAIVWSAPEGDALDWGSLVSFRFEAVADPVSSVASLSAVENPGGLELAIPTRAPTQVPEPAAGLLRLTGLLGLAALGRAGVRTAIHSR
jgi:hypothetical protein